VVGGGGGGGGGVYLGVFGRGGSFLGFGGGRREGGGGVFGFFGGRVAGRRGGGGGGCFLSLSNMLRTAKKGEGGEKATYLLPLYLPPRKRSEFWLFLRKGIASSSPKPKRTTYYIPVVKSRFNA